MKFHGRKILKISHSISYFLSDWYIHVWNMLCRRDVKRRRSLTLAKEKWRNSGAKNIRGKEVRGSQTASKKSPNLSLASPSTQRRVSSRSRFAWKSYILYATGEIVRAREPGHAHVTIIIHPHASCLVRSICSCENARMSSWQIGRHKKGAMKIIISGGATETRVASKRHFSGANERDHR